MSTAQTPEAPVARRVAVIGGGVSGLAAARAFAERGHDVVGIERADDFGGVWHPSQAYPGVQTQSPKDLYRYTDMPMPEDYPEWPAGPQVHGYLCAYAARHALRERYVFGTSVEAMRRPAEGGGWELELSTQGDRRTERFDKVVVCTGQFSTPHRPDVPGLDVFEAEGGVAGHSSELRDVEGFEGEDVLVVGASKSGTDIAVQAANAGARSVTIAYRRDVWRVPYKVGGINFKNLLYMRAQEIQFPAWDGHGLSGVVNAILKPLAWANFRGLETLLKLQLGLGRHGMVPETRIEDEASCALPIVTPGFFPALRSGAIRAVRSAPATAEAGAVVLASGERVACTRVVFATGWKLAYPFLPAEVAEHLLEEDGQYRLYRWAVCPEVPDLGFVGANSSFCTVLTSEMIANWLVRYFDGQLARQPDADEMRADVDAMLSWKRNERPAASVYGGQCVAPFHFRHFDQLLEDMGAATTRPGNPARAWLTYPRADDYGRFLASAPHYEAAAAS